MSEDMRAPVCCADCGAPQCPRTPIEACGGAASAARPARSRSRLITLSVQSGAFSSAATASSSKSSWKKASSSSSPGVSLCALNSRNISWMWGQVLNEVDELITNRTAATGREQQPKSPSNIPLQCGLVFERAQSDGAAA